MDRPMVRSAPFDPLLHPSLQDAIHSQHAPPSRGTNSLSFPQSAPMHNLTGRGTQMHSSRTWTTSSGELGLLSDTDEVEDRALFVQEYNRLAKKHGLRVLVVEDFDLRKSRKGPFSPHRRGGWIYRMLRSASSQPTAAPKSTTHTHAHHKRSVSDLAHHLVHSHRLPSECIDIQTMVRLCGKSMLYLPAEHAPCALVLPTCLRATAHHLSQHVTTRGIFRISGSVRTVKTLCDYYCYTEHSSHIAGTVRCANLPLHIPASVHDVASTFKRLLSALPGGILGSLSIFDAFVSIYSQLHGDPEFPRTKQTKVRARLIALAIGAIGSQFRRELICAVFGLLSLIGRVAEVTPREDDEGRPLPTADLMGYNALGIIFGPLLVGDLLEQYPDKWATPESGFTLSPTKRKERRKSKGSDPKSFPNISKVFIANNIAEMLIANWRDIVRQMKALGMQHRKEVPSVAGMRNSSLQQSASESFVITKPQDWDESLHARSQTKGDGQSSQGPRDESPEIEAPTLSSKRQRPKKHNSSQSNRLSARPSITLLSPPTERTEESAANDEEDQGGIPPHSIRAIEPQLRGIQSSGRQHNGSKDKGQLHNGDFHDQGLQHKEPHCHEQHRHGLRGHHDELLHHEQLYRELENIGLQQPLRERVSIESDRSMDAKTGLGNSNPGLLKAQPTVTDTDNGVDPFNPHSWDTAPVGSEGLFAQKPPRRRQRSSRNSPQVSLEDVPPRTSSKPRRSIDRSSQTQSPSRSSDQAIRNGSPMKERTTIERRNGIRVKGPRQEPRKERTYGTRQNLIDESREGTLKSVRAPGLIDRHFTQSPRSVLSLGCEALEKKKTGAFEGPREGTPKSAESHGLTPQYPSHFRLPELTFEREALAAKMMSSVDESNEGTQQSTRALGLSAPITSGAPRPDLPSRSECMDKNVIDSSEGLMGTKILDQDTLEEPALCRCESQPSIRREALGTGTSSTNGRAVKSDDTPRHSQDCLYGVQDAIDQQTARSDGAPKQGLEYLYLAQNGDVQPRYTIEIPEPVNRNSMDKTPHTGKPRGEIEDLYWRVSKEEEADADNKRLIGSLSLSSQEPGRFNTLSGGTPQPVKSPPPETFVPWNSVPRATEQFFMRPSVAEAGNKPGAVRAMAAYFEGGEDSRDPPPTQRPDSRTQSRISLYSQGSPTKTARSSRSGSNQPLPGARNSSLSSQNQQIPRKPSFAGSSQLNDPPVPKLRTSVSEGVALRAAALAEAEKHHHGLIQDKVQLRIIQPPVPLIRAEVDEDGPEMRSPYSLGTMVPHQEPPPVAQHLNLFRPSSSSSNARESTDSEFLTPTPISRPSSTTLLHAQIRNLQRQLHSRLEEVSHLKRQVEALEGTEVGTLSQQLREAKREARMWKDRAEAAERRVKVFERFTARLRGIRDAAAVADRLGGRMSEALSQAGSIDGSGDASHDKSTGTRYLTGRGTSRIMARGSEDEMSDSTGRTEDAGVIQARIRKCLHGGLGKTDGPADSPPLTLGSLVDARSPHAQRGTMKDISQSGVEIWMAAQELLNFADGESLYSQGGNPAL
ncbi:Fc.00g046760.m01.CDS01 [Cosmosporella sp. VM-42]